MTIGLRETQSLNIRVEAFNVSNHAQFYGATSMMERSTICTSDASSAQRRHDSFRWRSSRAFSFWCIPIMGCVIIEGFMDDKRLPEAWMRGIVQGVDPVIGHLLRAAEQIHEDAATAIGDLTPERLWSAPRGMTSAGFHAKHLAGSTERLCTYLEGNQLTAKQLAAIGTEGGGDETAADLLSSIDLALNRYRDLVQTLSPQNFGANREIGRKRYQTTVVSVAIHIAEHAQRHIGGMIAAAKLIRA